VQRSNEHSQILLSVLARFSPEEAGRLGVQGFDKEVLDLSPGFTERRIRALEEARGQIQALLAKEVDGPIKQDLEILRGSTEDELQDIRLDEKHLLPYVKVAEVIYQGIRNLLEDRIPPERRQAALTRLKRYAGREDGYKPLAQAAEAYMRSEWVKPGRLPVSGRIREGPEYQRKLREGDWRTFSTVWAQGIRSRLPSIHPADHRLQRFPPAGDFASRSQGIPAARLGLCLSPQAVWSRYAGG
jgi:hypothetical protein